MLIRRAGTLVVCIVLVLVAGCLPVNALWGNSDDVSSDPDVAATLTPFRPFQSPDTTASILPTGTATREPSPSIWISAAVPASLRQTAQEWGYLPADNITSADILFDVETDSLPQSDRFLTWIYALVAPFPTVADGVTQEELRLTWLGQPGGDFAGLPLWMDESTLAALTAIWGEPAVGVVQVTEAAGLLEAAWAARPCWGIVPFEELEPRWKVLSIDGTSPIRKDFDQALYPLVVSFSIDTAIQAVPELPTSNRDPEKLTTLVMTGVTALVRATAYAMETKGVLFPSSDVGDWLTSADLTHISNEIPFAEDCPYPDPSYGMRPFCSDPKYVALLEDIGTDVVELTGNHFQDWGSEATLFTLELYKQKGWPYYGGGADLVDARKAITVEHNGNHLAFIGCNTVGPAYAWASESQPGAAPCDMQWIQSEVYRLRYEGYLPIVTFQHDELYTIVPHPDQQLDFRPMIEAGAVIVNGSQSHVPQGMEFYAGGFIHYGLGNLFFDQMDSLNTRQELIDRHVFYDGRHISIELMTAMLEDYARPRPMTSAERLELLQLVFGASVWNLYP